MHLLLKPDMRPCHCPFMIFGAVANTKETNKKILNIHKECWKKGTH